tara:strand:- start:2101 stop:3099 length:999 start_codon:yes stop_codon:yes gene_type:complete
MARRYADDDSYGKIVPQGRRSMRKPRSLLEALWYTGQTTTNQPYRQLNEPEPVGTSAARRREAESRVGADAPRVFDIYSPSSNGLAASTGAAAGGLGMGMGAASTLDQPRTQYAQAGTTMTDATRSSPASTGLGMTRPTTSPLMTAQDAFSAMPPSSAVTARPMFASQSPVRALRDPAGPVMTPAPAPVFPSLDGVRGPGGETPISRSAALLLSNMQNGTNFTMQQDPQWQAILQRGAARGEYSGGAPDFNDNITNRPLPDADPRLHPAVAVFAGPGRPGTMTDEYNKYMGYDKTWYKDYKPSAPEVMPTSRPVTPSNEGPRDFNKYFGGMP